MHQITIGGVIQRTSHNTIESIAFFPKNLIRKTPIRREKYITYKLVYRFARIGKCRVIHRGSIWPKITFTLHIDLTINGDCSWLYQKMDQRNWWSLCYKKVIHIFGGANSGICLCWVICFVKDLCQLSVQKQFILWNLRWDPTVSLPVYENRLLLLALSSLEKRRFMLGIFLLVKLIYGGIDSPVSLEK